MQTSLKETDNFFYRITKISDYQGFKSINDFSVNGLGYTSPQKILRLKEDRNKPSVDILLNISNKFELINPTWLLTGKGEMLVEEKPSVATVATHGAQLDTQHGKIIEINPQAAKTNTLIADVQASAGFGAIVNNDQALEELPSIHLPNAPQGLNIAFQISGDSMHPTIRHMDFVAGNKINDVKDIREGYTYIIVHKYEGVLCKRLYRLGTDWQIVSDNPTYKPHNYPQKEIIAIYKAFCRWSYDFRNYHDDVRADIQQIKIKMNELEQRL